MSELLPPGPGDELIEYPLPYGDLPGLVHPRLAELARLDGEAARRRLAEGWRGLEQPGVIRLGEQVAEFVPEVLVISGTEARLAMRRGRAGYLYLGAPPDEAALDRSLEAWGFSGAPALGEFYRNFHLLADSPPGGAGHFISPPGWESFGDFGWFDNPADAGEAAAWLSAPVIFNARNGDLLLLKPTGESAWGILSRGEVRGIAGSFESLLDRVASCIEADEAIDSFSPPLAGW